MTTRAELAADGCTNKRIAPPAIRSPTSPSLADPPGPGAPHSDQVVYSPRPRTPIRDAPASDRLARTPPSANRAATLRSYLFALGLVLQVIPQAKFEEAPDSSNQDAIRRCRPPRLRNFRSSVRNGNFKRLAALR